MLNKKLLLGAGILVLAFIAVYFAYKPAVDGIVVSHIQTYFGSDNVCTNLLLTHHLQIGSTDANSEGEVTKLQTYLKTWGTASDNAPAKDLPVTGNFGPQTKEALSIFQKLHSIPTDPESDVATTVDWNNPYYGMVGPRTRKLLGESCLEGGFKEGAARSSTAPFLNILNPQGGTHSLSAPLVVDVKVAPVTFDGFVEIHLVKAEDLLDWKNKSRELAERHGLRDGFSGTLTFTLTDFSGNGLPQPPDAETIVPGEYVIIAVGYDGTSNSGRLMEATSSVITFTP